uniref:Uncharacterized protein LOC102804858 n=1 Tax=Saccoglossus kowalevskii TaxID=10224 RepID=A0ABM0MDF2_SACKO
MEMEGLKRSVAFLKEHADIGVVITDRHRQIGKYIREEIPEAVHQYDVWHVAKGLKKKVNALSKLKGCEDVGLWRRSLVNHMYWCSLSTPSGDGEMIAAKWKSIANHVQNKHSGHGELFPKCRHGPLHGRDRQKEWLKPSTKACEKLVDIITNTHLCNDVRKLSPLYQTYSLEGFHSLVIQFAPKMLAYSYNGMLS